MHVVYKVGMTDVKAARTWRRPAKEGELCGIRGVTRGDLRGRGRRIGRGDGGDGQGGGGESKDDIDDTCRGVGRHKGITWSKVLHSVATEDCLLFDILRWIDGSHSDLIR